VDVAQSGTFSGCDQLTAQIIGGGNDAGGQVLFVVLIYVKYGLAAFRLFDAVAVAVVDKGRPAGDR
jgi:hypothetical protein